MADPDRNFQGGGILSFFLPFDQNFLVQRNCGSRCFSFRFFRRKQGEKLSRLFFVELFTNLINLQYINTTSIIYARLTPIRSFHARNVR